MLLDAFRLDGKVALVTGSSAGLGAAIAVALAEAGAHVACHGNTRRPEATGEMVERAARQSLAVLGDLQDRTTPRRLIEATLQRFGQLDILVNNAGIIRRAPAAEHAEEDWDTVIEVNLSSVFRLSQLAGQHMLERGRGRQNSQHRFAAFVSRRRHRARLCGGQGRGGAIDQSAGQ